MFLNIALVKLTGHGRHFGTGDHGKKNESRVTIFKPLK